MLGKLDRSFNCSAVFAFFVLILYGIYCGLRRR